MTTVSPPDTLVTFCAQAALGTNARRIATITVRRTPTLLAYSKRQGLAT
jgi:hypothetical protein